MAKFYKPNAYNSSPYTGVGGNSVSVVDGDFVTDANDIVTKAVAGGVISGLSTTSRSFASDNQTVAQAHLQYTPATGKLIEVGLSATTGAEVGKYYDITSAGLLDVASESLSTGQLRIKKLERGIAVVEVVNL